MKFRAGPGPQDESGSHHELRWYWGASRWGMRRAMSFNVIQVTNVSPSASSNQMLTLFGILGQIEELQLFPPDDSSLPVTSHVCFVKLVDANSAIVAQHLTNTIFVDQALIVVQYAGVIPDETKELFLLAPPNAVVTRNYDEEEQGYDSKKEKHDDILVCESCSSKVKEKPVQAVAEAVKESKVNGDDHHEEDMDMSD
ncbi:hypothetical protein NDU88_010071 [Pleurodeles waltl]|uniref:RRM domain-containing protein n=1 Tax=Pleurodeles waltl TaxID=8319 RepID=A0AAV7PU44_PLEWA|nr:hypothetical protein NDU88_010071 [Pleurodeles waltl]